ncbi:MAG: hypothetical protein CUN57_00710, partial [Phototrophicales bacterium]
MPLGSLMAAETLMVDQQDSVNPTPYVRYLTDESRLLSIKDLIQTPDENFARAIDTEQLNFGYSTAAYWIKLHVANPTNQPVTRLLEVDYAVLDNVTFFLVENGVPREFY